VIFSAAIDQTNLTQKPQSRKEEKTQTEDTIEPSRVDSKNVVSFCVYFLRLCVFA
jgi:hypothetical protein